MDKELKLFIENTRSLFGIELQAETLDGAKMELEKHRASIEEAQKSALPFHPVNDQ